MGKRKGEKERGSPTMPDQYYAHSLPGRPPSEWQPLEVHLENVAELARGYAEGVGAGEWPEIKGFIKIC